MSVLDDFGACQKSSYELVEMVITDEMRCLNINPETFLYDLFLTFFSPFEVYRFS